MVKCIYRDYDCIPLWSHPWNHYWLSLGSLMVMLAFPHGLNLRWQTDDPQISKWWYYVDLDFMIIICWFLMNSWWASLGYLMGVLGFPGHDLLFPWWLSLDSLVSPQWLCLDSLMVIVGSLVIVIIIGSLMIVIGVPGDHPGIPCWIPLDSLKMILGLPKMISRFPGDSTKSCFWFS